MSGRRPFGALKKGWSAERKKRVADATQRLLEEYDLAALRDALGLTQNELAEGMEKAQSGVAKLEAQDDMKVSTLRRYIEQLGGKLSLRVELDDREVTLTGIGDPR